MSDHHSADIIPIEVVQAEELVGEQAVTTTITGAPQGQEVALGDLEIGVTEELMHNERILLMISLLLGILGKDCCP